MCNSTTLAIQFVAHQRQLCSAAAVMLSCLSPPQVQFSPLLLAALQFTQKKADGQIRWAVLNVAALLRRHVSLHDRLAAAMDRGASVGECIQLIEQQLAKEPEALAPSSVVSSGSISSTVEASSGMDSDR
eukprot:GHUV01028614.1.p1 GENE.GHUV01028614.1~~GHUV01028614.1.p1  ORF type:complete len:130 (+),score=25.23 GHUV01028614.1:163-552(+)